MVDPNVHANLLSSLHSAAAETEDSGRRFQQVLSDELESVIKVLSSCLLHPNGPRSELDDCISHFESALEHMQSAQKNIDLNVARLQTLGTHIPGR